MVHIVQLLYFMKSALKTSDKVKVKKSARKGRGVFAAETILKGERIELAPCLIFDRKDYKLLVRTDLVRFIYDAGAKQGAIGLGYASLYNHSETANADYDVNRRRQVLLITASRTIYAGEEITIDYGYHPAQTETWDPEYKRYMNRLKKTS